MIEVKKKAEITSLKVEKMEKDLPN